jgi:hypothetical protein
MIVSFVFSDVFAEWLQFAWSLPSAGRYPGMRSNFGNEGSTVSQAWPRRL